MIIDPTQILDVWSRRAFCQLTSLSALGWFSSRALALAEGQTGKSKTPGKSLIFLWMNGGPSQLETFDPHPGTKIGGPTKAITTRAPGVKIAEGLPRTAEVMDSIALVRSVMSKEGDHDRGRYLMKTGYRPNPSVEYPSLGSICAANLEAPGLDLPPYISIQSEKNGDLANHPSDRGGVLGQQYDPFRIGDPMDPLPDMVAPVDGLRRERRSRNLEVIEKSLGRRNAKTADRTNHLGLIKQATATMNSAQLRAFDIKQEPVAVREAYGDSLFGRGCLAARRLVQEGVRCVQVQLPGWDTHFNNFEGTAVQNKILDPALSALIADLRRTELLDRTLVVCCGEFGRTPAIGLKDGRDHWNHGFSVAFAGGGIRGGVVVGQTDPEGKPKTVDPQSVDDLFATILTTLGIRPETENLTSTGRPIKLSEGKPIQKLLR